jgi:hypothetical protein
MPLWMEGMVEARRPPLVSMQVRFDWRPLLRRWLMPLVHLLLPLFRPALPPHPFPEAHRQVVVSIPLAQLLFLPPPRRQGMLLVVGTVLLPPLQRRRSWCGTQFRGDHERNAHTYTPIRAHIPIILTHTPFSLHTRKDYRCNYYTNYLHMIRTEGRWWRRRTCIFVPLNSPSPSSHLIGVLYYGGAFDQFYPSALLPLFTFLFFLRA